MGARGTGRKDERAAVRRILADQYAVIVKNEAGVLRGEIQPLHDLRVAMRRLRTLLRSFRKTPAGTPAGEVEGKLKQISDRLGPVRDSQTWTVFLHSKAVRKQLSGTREWQRFIKTQERLLATSNRTLAQVLSSRLYRSTKTAIDALIDGMARVPATVGHQAQTLTAEALTKALAKVKKRLDLSPRMKPDEIHQLRIACRRARYLAEFCAGSLGAPAAELAESLKEMQDVLGRVHDADIWIEQAQRQRFFPPQKLAASLRRQRRKKIKRFLKVRDRFKKNLVRFGRNKPAKGPGGR